MILEQFGTCVTCSKLHICQVCNSDKRKVHNNIGLSKAASKMQLLKTFCFPQSRRTEEYLVNNHEWLNLVQHN